MDQSTTPLPQVEASFSPVWRVEFNASKRAPAQPSPVEKAFEEQSAEQHARAINQLLPGELLVEIDRAAGRFVHVLLDSTTQEVEWRYPSETQLAYSRAVRAYAEAASSR